MFQTAIGFVVSFTIMFRITSLRTAGIGSMVSSVLMAQRSTSSEGVSATNKELFKNPLLSKKMLPNFSEIQTKDIKPAVEYNLKNLDSEFAKFEEKVLHIKHNYFYTNVN